MGKKRKVKGLVLRELPVKFVRFVLLVELVHSALRASDVWKDAGKITRFHLTFIEFCTIDGKKEA